MNFQVGDIVFAKIVEKKSRSFINIREDVRKTLRQHITHNAGKLVYIKGTIIAAECHNDSQNPAEQDIVYVLHSPENAKDYWFFGDEISVYELAK